MRRVRKPKNFHLAQNFCKIKGGKMVVGIKRRDFDTNIQYSCEEDKIEIVEKEPYG